DLELGVVLAADRAREVDAIAPDDGAGVPEPGDRRAPADSLFLLDVPGLRRGIALGDAGGVGTAELWPVDALAVGGAGQCGASQQDEQRQGAEHGGASGGSDALRFGAA